MLTRERERIVFLPMGRPNFRLTLRSPPANQGRILLVGDRPKSLRKIVSNRWPPNACSYERLIMENKSFGIVFVIVLAVSAVIAYVSLLAGNRIAFARLENPSTYVQ